MDSFSHPSFIRKGHIEQNSMQRSIYEVLAYKQGIGMMGKIVILQHTNIVYLIYKLKVIKSKI